MFALTGQCECWNKSVVSIYKAQTGNLLSATSFRDGGGHALSKDELQLEVLLWAEPAPLKQQVVSLPDSIFSLANTVSPWFLDFKPESDRTSKFTSFLFQSNLAMFSISLPWFSIKENHLLSSSQHPKRFTALIKVAKMLYYFWKSREKN